VEAKAIVNQGSLNFDH